jgi:hypothetical protein
MVEIQRARGSNPSESYLADLAELTFLDLWSYPNVYNDKRATPNGSGQELCDLLVVCGDHVLIFSCKNISWPETDDFNRAWSRWFRRAIKDSAKQIRGAQRWIDQFPQRVFVDRMCTQSVPLRLPPKERRKVHGIVVALGAGEACRKYFKGGIGSLILDASLSGDEHLADDTQPFFVGDVNPHGSFIHVFDDATLGIAMRELDTITDFTSYLTRKEAAIRSGRLGWAFGEEDVLAYYATHTNPRGEHDFTKPDGSLLEPRDVLVLEEGIFTSLLSNPQYVAKKAADEVSYVWDRLILRFTRHLLQGTNIVPEGSPADLGTIEEGVRHMVLVPRFIRRGYGAAIVDALHRGMTKSRNLKAFLPDPETEIGDTGFYFMTLALPTTNPHSYDDYRQLRAVMLRTYGFGLLHRYPHLKRVVGVASEPAPSEEGPQGSSEDLALIYQQEWSDREVDDLQHDLKALDMFAEGQYSETRVRTREFPENESP